jgi:hypothetical protein
MSEPLEDKMLEAVAQIVTPWCDDLETNRKGVQETPSMARRTLQAAIRETLAGELAAALELLAGFAEKASTLDFNEDRNITWATVVAAQSRALLARFEELVHK